MESFFFAWNSIFLVVGFSLAWTYFLLQVKIIYLKIRFGEFCIFSLVFPFNYFNGKTPQNLKIMKIGKLVQLVLSLQELSLCFSFKTHFFLIHLLHTKKSGSFSAEFAQQLYAILIWRKETKSISYFVNSKLECFIALAIWHTMENVLDVNCSEIFVVLLILSDFPMDKFSQILYNAYVPSLF